MNNVLYNGLVCFKNDYYYYASDLVNGIYCAKSCSIKYISIKRNRNSIYLIVLGEHPGNLRLCSSSVFICEFGSYYKNLLKRNNMVEIKND